MSEVGVRQRISALGGPHVLGLSPAQGAGPALSLLCPLMVSGAQAEGDSARVGDSMDAQPHSSAWEQQHSWQRGDTLSRAESQALSTGVTTRPQGLSEAGGLWGEWAPDRVGPRIISGLSPTPKLIVPAHLGLSPAAHRKPHPGGSDPNPELLASPPRGSRSTAHTPVSCSLSLPFHSHVRGLHTGRLGCGATVNRDIVWNKWDYSF